MKVTIFGSGYVGLVTGACLAEVGNHVLCVDIDEQKVSLLKQGRIPIHEPGLAEMIRANMATGRLSFTTDITAGVTHGLFQFIAVGTPPGGDGSADLQYVLAVARSIGRYRDEYCVVVNKSTVPVGTADKVRNEIQGILTKRGVKLEFDVVSNPEFLKEGAAIDDFMRPDRIIIGTGNALTTEQLRALYAPFIRNHDRIIVMDPRSAELTKYAANAMLATKISFMNELANLAERLGADIERVRVGMGADPRIGYHFIYPGCGYGGSCFPKDIQALERTAHEIGYHAQLLQAVRNVNTHQKQVLFHKINQHFGGQLQGRRIALWGLAFKPNTDDVREAPSRTLMEALWAAGASVQAHDPAAMDEIHRIYGDRPDLILCPTPLEACHQADALAICTEWNVFRSPDFVLLKKTLKATVIFDGRNLYDASLLKREGYRYYAIGRADNLDTTYA